eukprot:1455389-Prymnesium_polylepis.1
MLGGAARGVGGAASAGVCVVGHIVGYPRARVKIIILVSARRSLMSATLCALVAVCGLSVGARVPTTRVRARSPHALASPTFTGASSCLSFEQVATIPKPGAMGLGNIQFSPDDRYVTYLGSADAASLTRQLFAYDRETGETKQVISSGGGEESFTKEEKLRRERARIMSVGITEYSWASQANRILVPLNGARPGFKSLCDRLVGFHRLGIQRPAFDP